jgi:Helix-turn-helix domain
MATDAIAPLPQTDLTTLNWLVGKVQSLEAMISGVDVKLDSLRETLGNRRKDHYLVEEIAETTGRSCYTVRRWITEKKLIAIRLRDGGPRGKLLIPRTEIERLIASGKGAEVPTATLT